MGYEVTVASNYIDGSTCDEKTVTALKNKLDALKAEHVQIDFDRNVFGVIRHIRAFKQLKALLKANRYDLIHCHSPIGGLLTRLAVPRRHKDQKVIYTAHGFHFYKGAPVKNWLIYYSIEKLCSRNTDVLITINTEDYNLAKNKLKAKETHYIPGVGINTEVERLPEGSVKEFRDKLGIKADEALLLSVGELNKNKNHIFVIKALGMLSEKRPELKWQYYICGQGGLKEELGTYIRENGLSERVHLVGFTNEIKSFLASADLFIHPSFREGLSVALMEAIAAGVPVICSDIRGNRDLAARNCLFDPGDVNSIERRFEEFFDSETIKQAVAQNTKTLEKCSLKNVSEQMKRIYAEC